jgi:hypothetical protein
MSNSYGVALKELISNKLGNDREQYTKEKASNELDS